MNIANFFTATRMVAAPLFICIYYLPRYVGISEQTVMLILIPLFIYMEFTDFLDGYYARKLKQVSATVLPSVRKKAVRLKRYVISSPKVLRCLLNCLLYFHLQKNPLPI